MNLAQRIARAQVTRAALFVVAAVALAALSLPVAAGLPLRSGFVELLPSTAVSVRDLRRAEGRVGGTSTLTLVATSNDSDALVRWAEAIGPRLESLPRALGVRSVEWNVRGYQRFVHDHRLMFAPLDELRRFRDDLRRTIEHQRRAAMPGFIDLDDPPEPADALLRRAREQAERAESSSRFPRGVFLHRDGHHLAVFLRADVRAGDADNARALARRVDAEVAATNPTSFAPDLRVERAGDLTVALAEHDAISKELLLATSLTLALCLAVVLGLFRRVRAVPLLAAALLVPVAVTFAFARLAVGHLNTSTAFLGSIVIGNGVNPGIVWLARYFEERRRGREVTDAVAAAHRGAWAGTLTASLAASLAYGSLVITDFRGFRDFGVIGGFGMVICWSLTLLLLPAFVALSERVSPLRLSLSGDANPYGRFFARVARRWPRGLAGGALALALGGAVAAGLAVAHDPLEYDFRKLTSVRSATARASLPTGSRGDRRPRGLGQRRRRAGEPPRRRRPPLRASLERARDDHGAPYGPVRSIDDLLPKEQPAKVEVLRDLRALLLDARPHASERVRAEIDANLPPADLRPLTDDDLPATAAGLFTERDGSRGGSSSSRRGPARRSGTGATSSRGARRSAACARPAGGGRWWSATRPSTPT
ncbi:MAG: MMPL family transporter [Polyangiales bacterium]